MAEINNENALLRIDDTVATLPDRPPDGVNLDGRGIVICAGGNRYFVCAWVCINMLRKQGCQLPIQMWHLGPKEVNDTMRRLLGPLNVTLVDAEEIRKQHPARILNGWEVKPYAIIHSPFREVLALDADNVPLGDPEFLFDSGPYREHGAIFWPDYGRLAKDRMIWKLTGAPYRDEPEFESGQIVVDKVRCWKALALTMWINEHSDFWYRHVHGDKETFHMGWRKLDQSYAMPKRGIHSLQATMCQHDFDGRRIFQHRNMAKWKLAGNCRIGGFDQEDDCIAFLEQLRPSWGELGTVLVYCDHTKTEEERQQARHLASRSWIYHRVGHDKRNMRFQLDGTIGEGAAGLETLWNLRQRNNAFVLDIQSNDALTCSLVLEGDGVWRGRWANFEKMPIELREVAAQVLPHTEETTIDANVNATAVAQLAAQEITIKTEILSPADLVAFVNATRSFVYCRVGFDQRRMELLPGGIIGHGAAALERRWAASEDGLALTGDAGIIAVLRPHDTGTFLGRWTQFERMPVILASANRATVDGEPRNVTEVRWIAQKRSGHHAIIGWLGNQLGNVCFLNDCSPFLDPYRTHTNTLPFIDRYPGFMKHRSHGRPPEDDFALTTGDERKRAEDLRRMAKDWLFMSYEDFDPSCYFPSFVQSLHVGNSSRIVNVLVIRDPFNHLASLLKDHQRTRRRHDYSKFVGTWKACAKEALGETNFVPDKYCILYNRWFADPEYRKRVAAHFGTAGDDGSLATVSPNGKGSSFDGNAFDGRAQEMEVLLRWKQFKLNAKYWSILKDDELWRYAKQLFGEIVPANEVG